MRISRRGSALLDPRFTGKTWLRAVRIEAAPIVTVTALIRVHLNPEASYVDQ